MEQLYSLRNGDKKRQNMILNNNFIESKDQNDSQNVDIENDEQQNIINQNNISQTDLNNQSIKYSEKSLFSNNNSLMQLKNQENQLEINIQQDINQNSGQKNKLPLYELKQQKASQENCKQQEKGYEQHDQIKSKSSLSDSQNQNIENVKQLNNYKKSYNIQPSDEMDKITYQSSKLLETDLKLKVQKEVRYNTYYKYMQEKTRQIWIKKAFQIFVILKSFINILKLQTNIFKFRNFNKKKFSLVNDKASSYDVLRSQDPKHIDYPSKIVKWRYLILLKFKPFLDLVNYGIPTFEQDSYFKKLWDVIILILLIINIFYLPIKITFESKNLVNLNSFQKLLFDDLPQYAFLLEIILNFNTASYSQGKLLKHRKDISQHYLRKDFKYDFIVIVPYFLIKSSDLQYADIILLLRTNKIFRLGNDLFYKWCQNEKKQAIFNLVRLVFIVIFVSHFMGCIFVFFAYIEEDSYGIENTWLKQYQESSRYQEKWYEDYVVSLYWAVITMITVGYGDIAPINIYEKIFVIFSTLFACGIFAYAINSIGSIIGDINKDQNEFKIQMMYLGRYMQKRQMSLDLQVQVKKYFEYFHKKQVQNNEQCQQTLNNLTGTLLQQVKQDMYGKIINNSKLLKIIFSDAFLRALALHMKEKRFGPQTIISDNATENSLYFVMDGTVSIYNLNIDLKKQSRKLLKIAGKNEIFNELRFLNDCTENLEIESNEMVEITYITKYDFLVQLKNFPLDYERYRQINDQLRVQQIYKGLSLKCDICASHMHTTNNCCFIHYTESKEKVIKQNSYNNREQMRNISFKRKFIRLDKAILIQDYLKEVVLQYIIDNDEASEDETLEKIQNILNHQNEYEQFKTKQETQNQGNHQSQLKRFRKLDIRELIQTKQLFSEGQQNNGIIISKDKEHREKRKSETQENILNMWRNQQSQKKQNYNYQVDTSSNKNNRESSHNISQLLQKIATTTNLQSSQGRIESLKHMDQSKTHGKGEDHIQKITEKIQNGGQSKSNSNVQINQLHTSQIIEESQNSNSDNEYSDNLNNTNSWQKNLTNNNSDIDKNQENVFKNNSQQRQICKNKYNFAQSISMYKNNSGTQVKSEKQNKILNSFVNSLKSLRTKKQKNSQKLNSVISQDQTEMLLYNKSYGTKNRNSQNFNPDTYYIQDKNNFFSENTNNFFLKSKWINHTQEDQFLVISEFDVFKNFKIYYPHNNCQIILEKFLHYQRNKFKVDFGNKENHKAKDKQKLQALVFQKKKTYSKMVMSKPMHRKIHNNLTQIKKTN